MQDGNKVCISALTAAQVPCAGRAHGGSRREESSGRLPVASGLGQFVSARRMQQRLGSGGVEGAGAVDVVAGRQAWQ
jgi:hypothetical protein